MTQLFMILAGKIRSVRELELPINPRLHSAQRGGVTARYLAIQPAFR